MSPLCTSTFLSLLTLPLSLSYPPPPPKTLPCSKQTWERGGILVQQPRVRPRTRGWRRTAPLTLQCQVRRRGLRATVGPVPWVSEGFIGCFRVSFVYLENLDLGSYML